MVVICEGLVGLCSVVFRLIIVLNGLFVCS